MALKIVLGLLAVVLLMQLVPVDRSNPPVTGEVTATPAAQQVLERSCYDCHSNQTNWPWYSYVAPVSWLVAGDVHEGREHMNFSEWESYSGEDRTELAEHVVEEVEEGEMPLGIYLTMHSDAEVSAADLEALRGWSQSVAGTGGGDAEPGETVRSERGSEQRSDGHEDEDLDQGDHDDE